MPNLRSTAQRVLKGTVLEAPARSMMFLRHPDWRQDRLDNERLKLLIAFTLREDACAVDVGAHKGLFLREMLRVAPKGQHVAFEALPELANALAEEFPAATIHASALGATTGSITFMRNKSVLAQSGIHGRRELGGQDLEEIEVPITKLDDALPDGFVPTLIKVDVEGAEGLVFEGARETIGTHRPIVWFEHGAPAAREHGTEPGDIYATLTDCGLRIFDVNGRGPYTAAEFAAPPKMTWTFVAH